MMLEDYDLLRQKYITEGYQAAYSFVDELDQNQKHHCLVITNFYCYISIQSEFKVTEILEILEECLACSECSGSLKALTVYHLASACFKLDQYSQCKDNCFKVIQEFIGIYYSMEKRLLRSQSEQNLFHQLQQILYYTFLMLAYICREDNYNNSTVYINAGNRIMKNCKNKYKFMLTSKSFPTRITADEDSENDISKPPSFIEQEEKKPMKYRRVDTCCI